MVTKIIDCRRCDGNGYFVKDKGIIEELFSIFVFGGDTEECKSCQGKGFFIKDY